MSDVEVRGGANDQWLTKHDRKNREHVADCSTCKRVESFLRSMRGGSSGERGTWSDADLTAPVGVERVRRDR